MEKKIKKIGIIFFGAMFFFTILSRVAASVIVAKVSVDKAKRGSLNYEIIGNGIIKENAQKNIDLLSGYKVNKVNVKVGQTVEKGEWLFSYDLGQLENKKSELDKQIAKLNLQYEKSEVADTAAQGTAADLAVKQAKEDLAQAKEARKDIKKEVKENKRKEYNAAVKEVKSISASKKTAVKNAKRSVADARNELDQLERSISKLPEVLENYKASVNSKQDTLISIDYDNIFDLYYNGEYKEHKSQVAAVEKDLQRAREDLDDIRSYGDEFTYNSSLKNARRAVEDYQEKLNQLKEDDTKLSNAIQIYRQSIESDTSNQSAYDALYQLIYNHFDIDETQIAAAKTKWNRAIEDETNITEEWNSKLDEANKKKEKLYQELQAMKDGSYDYEEELKEGNKAVQQAERLLSQAENALLQSQKNEKANHKSTELDQDSIQIDIDEKQAELDALEKLIKEKGKIKSPIQGVISELGISQGTLLTGGEKLLIATGGYELLMEADKDDMKYFSVGGSIQIYTLKDTVITSVIENIEMPDQNNIVRFTALLPEGDYKNGNTLGFILSKRSQDYFRCIPIQAVRQDSSNNTFILIVKEKESVLGTEQTAFRINISVDSMDMRTAAISASISEDDLIITGSNKNISEGDRVRIDANENE